MNLTSDQLPYFIITAIHLPVVGSYSCITVLSIFIYAVLVHEHWSIPTCANDAYLIVAVVSSLPPSDSLSLTSGYCPVPLFTPCMGLVTPIVIAQSLNQFTVTCNSTCLPQTHNTRH